MRSLTESEKEMIEQAVIQCTGNKEKLLKSLAKTCNVDVEVIKEFLRGIGLMRQAPKKPVIKKPVINKQTEEDVKIYEPAHCQESEKAADEEAADHPVGSCQNFKPTMPDYVQEILFKEHKKLEAEMDATKSHLAELEAKYAQLSTYLFT